MIKIDRRYIDITVTCDSCKKTETFKELEGDVGYQLWSELMPKTWLKTWHRITISFAHNLAPREVDICKECWPPFGTVEKNFEESE